MRGGDNHVQLIPRGDERDVRACARIHQKKETKGALRWAPVIDEGKMSYRHTNKLHIPPDRLTAFTACVDIGERCYGISCQCGSMEIDESENKEFFRCSKCGATNKFLFVRAIEERGWTQ